MTLTHLSLFSGIGGIDLAAEWAGFETVGQCEWADYPTKVLEKHWPDVPRWRDIKTLTKEGFYERTGLRTVDLISGGFPCQPFSVAGKQKGEGDDRYLWPEMLRVIRELKPRWILGENVPGILRIAGRTVCEDLEREGHDVAIFDFEAASVGAPHRRERVFFVANARGRGFGKPKFCSEWQRRTEIISASEAVADPPRELRERDRSIKNKARLPEFTDASWWEAEPNVGRVAHGVSARVDRLKGLGNAVVPQQVYPILAAIATLDTELEEEE